MKKQLIALSVSAALGLASNATVAATLILKEIHCIDTQGIGADDTYVTINGEKVWGVVEMSEGERQPIYLRHTFTQNAFIQIWEKDSGPDDLIGGFQVTARQGGEKRRNISGDGSEYWIYYKIED
jgi:hypothetical protein